MHRDFGLGRTSYLPRIQYNQFNPTQKNYQNNNSTKLNYLELSLNNRSPLTSHYQYNKNSNFNFLELKINFQIRIFLETQFHHQNQNIILLYHIILIIIKMILGIIQLKKVKEKIIL